MYYIVSFMPPGSMDRAARRIEQAGTMAEAQAICRSREKISMSVGCCPFICKGFKRDRRTNAIIGYIDMLFLE